MPDRFRQKIHLALADSQLQSALDNNAERRQGAFTAAFESLPEGRQAFRQRAHDIRQAVVADLDRYLEQFAKKAAANGMTIHYASDAGEAVETVLRIAQDAGASLIAKSKTMVGEEIHLNEHLEAKGFRVVETDLGEYIIQLRGEPPAHIITPAVHLTRAQVAKTFEEKIGLPFTTDIPALTAAARRVLRATFLQADIGISGVNFGVAETGTLVLVTNEGNGRMCTSLPDIHIALMGIERLVPSFADLAVMLNLLPRSATGQKLSVYTSLIHSPRSPEEGEGPSQRHLILLDNGRQSMRFSPLSEALYCIRCGACLNACPVFREIGGHAYVGPAGQPTTYPGPIGSLVSPGLFGIAKFGNLARATSLCGACKDACPVDIDLPGLLLRVRAGAGAQAGAADRPRAANLENAVDTAKPAGINETAYLPPTSDPHVQTGLSEKSKNLTQKPPSGAHIPIALRIGLFFFSIFARSPARYQLAQRFAGVFTRLVPGSDGWMHMPAFTGWGLRRDFPRFALRPFSASPLARQLALHKPGSPPLQLNRKAPVGKPISAAPIVAAQPIPGVDDENPLTRFSDELKALGGEVIRCRLDDLSDRVLAALQVRQESRIQAWEPAFLPPGLLDVLNSQGISITHTADPSIRIGLTGALAGIAETGSLVIPAALGCPPSASLLPEIHMAVLPSERLLPRLADALALPEIPQFSSVSIVTGPSRTADIEMTLTIGVHGPGELVVFLLAEPLIAA